MRFLIKFSYDGTNYAGFQNQPNLKTIQNEIETAATIVNNNINTKITATGRTDKKVHAKCQYAHLDIDVNITPKKLKRALNSNLPADIHIIDAYHVVENFHARYNVISKTYKYYINVGEYNPLERNYVFQYNYNLNLSAMRQAIKKLIGEHDYRAFVTENITKQNCIRKIFDAYIEEDKVDKNKYIITFTGNGFMRYQVRNMVGLLIKVGENKLTANDVKTILDSKSRKKNGATAPAEGLYLEKVEYEHLNKYIID